MALNIQNPRNIMGTLPAICPDMVRNQLVLREIAPLVDEWRRIFLKDIQFRGFKPVSSDQENCILNYKMRYRILMNIETNENDIWLYPKFKVHPTFLKVALIGLGAGILIFLGLIFLLLDSYLFSYISSIFLPIIGIMVTVITFAVLMTIFRGHKFPAYGLAQTAPILMELYQAARYAEKQILLEYPIDGVSLDRSQNFCTQCGKTMEPSWRVCPFCGTALHYR